MKGLKFLPLEYSVNGQNVRWQWSKRPVGMVKTSGGSGQNVRFKSFLVIVSNNSFLVIAGAKLKLTRTYYYFFSFCQQASTTHSAKPILGYRSLVDGFGLSSSWSLICSTRSFGKRMFFLVEVVRLSDRGAFLLLSSCIGCAPVLYWIGAHHDR